MLKIVPAILTSDEAELKEMLSRCEGVVERVQIDIIDGIFADNKTVDPEVLESVETKLKIDYQLMVKDPIEWIEKCRCGKAQRIIGHLEMMDSQKEFVDKVVEVGLEVGLGLDLDTSVDKLENDILKRLDCVLVMSVKAGFGGQEFCEKVIKKIKRLNELKKKEGYDFKICVDGGVTLDNIKIIAEAGTDEVAIGRKLFKGNLAANIEKYKESCIW